MTTEKPSKLQIKAKIVSTIEALCSMENIDEPKIDGFVAELKEYGELDFSLEQLIKEFLYSKDEKKIYVISFLLTDLIPKEKLENKLWAILADKSVEDKAKYYVIDLLRQLGNAINYEKFVDYLNEPQELIDIDTKKLLNSASINPEAVIDFLDFFSSLPKEEKSMLVESLSEDYSGDDLCNILMPIVYSSPEEEIAEYVLKMIAHTKSALAISILNWVIETQKKEALITIAKIGLKTLKLAGVYFDNTNIFYTNALQNSEQYKCYSSMPDGHGNQGIVFTRLQNTSTISLVAVVTNEQTGIVDCFGFYSLDINEFSRVLDKFFDNDVKTEVSFEYTKKLLVDAEKQSYLYKNSIGYEYVAWRILLADVKLTGRNFKLEEKSIKLYEPNLTQLYKLRIMDKWFFEADINPKFKKLICKIDAEEKLDEKKLNQLAGDEYDNIFDKKTTAQLCARIENTAYLINQTEDNEFALSFKSLIDNKDILEICFMSILKKSVYEHYLHQKFKHNESKNSLNLFRARNKPDENIDINKINEAIELIERCWCKE